MSLKIKINILLYTDVEANETDILLHTLADKLKPITKELPTSIECRECNIIIETI